MRTMKKVKKVVLRGRLSLDRNRLNGDPYIPCATGEKWVYIKI